MPHEVNLVVAESAEGLIGSGYVDSHPLHAYMYVEPAHRGSI
jgi:hypothetical protein